jgi:hypothetical protein
MNPTRREFLQTSLSLSATACAAQCCFSDDVKTKVPAEYADAVFAAGEPPLPSENSFTIAVMPDTQFYSERYPETFQAQTRWIAENVKTRRISAVLQLGDITNRNSTVEWERAQAAMSVFDGTVPYFMAVGNHDYGARGGFENRTTQFNQYFPLEKFRSHKNFGGVYDREPEKMENSFHLFSAAGRDFLVLSLEMAPRTDVVRWANEIVDKHPQRECILITHAYMYHDDTRYDFAKYGNKQNATPRSYKAVSGNNNDGLDGEQLWQQLVSKHKNFILTLNGHVLGDGLAKLISRDHSQREVPQVLVNFQMKPKGGDGWLRLLEFRNNRTVQTYDYSPTREQTNTSSQNQFEFTLPEVTLS